MHEGPPRTEVWKRWEGQLVDGRFPLQACLGSSDHSGVFLTEHSEHPRAALKLIPAIPTSADWQFACWNAAASRPPLMADRCRRTQFISLIVAPDRSRDLFTSCLSSSDRPSIGSGMRADPPPEIRQSTRSSAVRPCTLCRMRPAAARPLSSGTG